MVSVAEGGCFALDAEETEECESELFGEEGVEEEVA